MSRFNHLLNSYRNKKENERKRNILDRSKPSVETNGAGTTGYRFKAGPHKDQVAGHIVVTHPNKNYR